MNSEVSIKTAFMLPSILSHSVGHGKVSFVRRVTVPRRLKELLYDVSIDCEVRIATGFINPVAHKVAASREVLLGKEDLPKSRAAPSVDSILSETPLRINLGIV